MIDNARIYVKGVEVKKSDIEQYYVTEHIISNSTEEVQVDDTE